MLRRIEMIHFLGTYLKISRVGGMAGRVASVLGCYMDSIIREWQDSKTLMGMQPQVACT